MTKYPLDFVPPLFGTPRTDSETLGSQVADISAKLGESLMPWQRHVADVAYELNDEGRLKYDEVVLTVPRQSGKTSLVRAKSIWRVSVGQAVFGGDQASAYLAQKRQDARKKLARDFVPKLQYASETGAFREVGSVRNRPIESTDWKLSMVNGAEKLWFGPNSHLQIETPSREAGHGDTIDDATIDEAFAHRDDAIEQALRPTMLTRKGSQLWIMSTAGDETSFYLFPKIRDGRAMIKAGEPTSTAYFEWGIPPEADIDDEDVWWQHHPALGRTIELDTLKRELARARRRTDEGAEDLFRRANCNQWVRVPILSDGDRPRAIDMATWQSRTNPQAQIVGDIAIGVDTWSTSAGATGRYGTHYIAVAGKTADGRTLVEVIHQQSGLMGLEDKLGQAVERYSPVAVSWDDGSGHALSPIIHRTVPESMLLPLRGREWAAACGAFKSAVDEGFLTHIGQDWLELAIEGVGKKQRGEGWVWDRLTASSDISPLCAATAAHWAIESQVPEAEGAFFMY